MLTVLNGHVSPETAYIIDSYPYGRLRCQMRVWIETKANQGQRYMTQTSNPKRNNDWNNKPKASTYGYITIIVQDDSNGHVHRDGLSNYPWVEEIAKFKAKFYDQLDAATKERFDKIETASRAAKCNQESWAKVDAQNTIAA